MLEGPIIAGLVGANEHTHGGADKGRLGVKRITVPPPFLVIHLFGDVGIYSFSARVW